MNNRYYSLDVFRGMTVALMILVNTPGSWSWIYPPLRHAEWHGLTPTDLVFPFFLFAVGNAMAFVMPKLQASGDAVFWNKVIKRTLLIFLIGLLLNWFPFLSWGKDADKNNALIFRFFEFTRCKDGKEVFGGVRITGVLQRIALCYFFASVMVYYLKRNGALFGAAALLLGYWLICYLLNPADPYSLTGWAGTDIDRAIIGKHHMYFGEVMEMKAGSDTLTNAWPKSAIEIGKDAANAITKLSNGNKLILFDPEGLLSTLGAIPQVILGYAVGKFILDNGSNRRTVERLLIAGIGIGIIGTLWHEVFPVNKKIWSSSYTVLTTGMAIIFIAIFIYLFEVLEAPSILGKFFDVFGKNPLFIFVLSGALPRLLDLFRFQVGSKLNNITNQLEPVYSTPLTWLKDHIFLPMSTDKQVGSLAYAVAMIIFYWLIAYIMDKRKIYVKV